MKMNNLGPELLDHQMRRLTLQEVGEVVRHFRTDMGLTQEELSVRAHTSVRTLQRLESGSQVSDALLEDVAMALRIPSEFFVGRVFPTDDGLKVIQRHTDDLKRKYMVVEATRIASWRDIDKICSVHAHLLDDSQLPGECDELAIELRQYLLDVIDCADVAEFGDRVTMFKELLELVNKVCDMGLQAMFATYRTDDGFDMSTTVFFPQSDTVCELRRNLLVPKNLMSRRGVASLRSRL